MSSDLNFDEAKSWPFAEARKLAEKFNANPPEKGYVLFETGYGPSGLPHIGTFAEVARTTMVRNAFEQLSDIPTKLIAFSDDMDGLRKVPDNLPEQEMIAENLGKPLTAIPDPFGTHPSFGEHMNSRLQAFLDGFGFDYEFKSATTAYKSGEFDEVLLRILEKYDDVINIILPTLGEERRATYSPFLPVCPETGKVLQIPAKSMDVSRETIVFDNEGEDLEVKVTGGECKLQWKVDWAMRWCGLGVDFEMHGKDLTPSAQLSSRITKTLGYKAPQNFVYEMFLDEKGEKISKSKGNGLTIEEWLNYATPESLSGYLFQSPQKAKKLYFDIIPKAVDEYLTFLKKYDEEPKADSPVWHVHGGNPPKPEADISFALLVNLASACNPDDESILWGFISKYVPEATPDNSPILDKLAGYAIKYYEDFVKPNKQYREPTDQERAAMAELADELQSLEDCSAADAQQLAYDVAKKHDYENMREWFGGLYEVLLGAKQGPRIGSFFALLGKDESVKLIQEKIA